MTPHVSGSDTTSQDHVDFAGLRITFDRRLLRPRSWTVAQSRWAARLMESAPDGPVLELCTGAGQIGLASIVDNERRLVCVDVEPPAADFCARNARAAGLAHRVEVRCGRLDQVLGPTERFAVIIADPPWVRRTDTGRFPEDPLLAIDGGEDGLDVARGCLSAVEAHLADGGSAVVQLGSRGQVEVLAAAARERGLVHHVATRSFGDQGVLAQFDRT